MSPPRQARGAVLFAADVHLSAARPRQVTAFVEFLAGPCREAAAVYLLGDIFDEWLGDDDDRDPHPQAVEALAALTGSGVPVHFAFGNHDFLVGPAFAARSGCRLIEQPARVEVHGTPVVVLHGDQLCTRDEDYQRWRRTFTDPSAQERFLALPFPARVAQAKALRHQSAELTRVKAEDIMDVTPGEVVSSLRRLDARHMVHGHTHRPAVHQLEVDGAPATRLVLGDWYENGRIVRWDANGPELVAVGAG